MTPATVHYGRAEQVHTERQRVLDAAYATTPERFVRRAPTPPPVPTAAWINKPTPTDEAASLKTDRRCLTGLDRLRRSEVLAQREDELVGGDGLQPVDRAEAGGAV